MTYQGRRTKNAKLQFQNHLNILDSAHSEMPHGKLWGDTGYTLKEGHQGASLVPSENIHALRKKQWKKRKSQFFQIKLCCAFGEERATRACACPIAWHHRPTWFLAFCGQTGWSEWQMVVLRLLTLLKASCGYKSQCTPVTRSTAHPGIILAPQLAAKLSHTGLKQSLVPLYVSQLVQLTDHSKVPTQPVPSLV